MSDDLFDLDLSKHIRRSDGSGIGNVTGSAVHLEIALDVGSTCYALDAKPEHVRSAFENAFTDFEFRREFGLHSPAAGTTIDLIITGLSAGAGIVAVEFLKEAGKDLWKALRSLLPEKKEARKDLWKALRWLLPRKKSDSRLRHRPRRRGVGDTISLTLVIDGNTVSSEITLPSPIREKSTEELLKQFCLDEAAKLYLEELERRKRLAPLSERLEAYKETKKRSNDTDDL